MFAAPLHRPSSRQLPPARRPRGVHAAASSVQPGTQSLELLSRLTPGTFVRVSGNNAQYLEVVDEEGPDSKLVALRGRKLRLRASGDVLTVHAAGDA